MIVHWLVRVPLALVAGGVTLAWLAALVAFPATWGDPHGYNQLAALILASALHWAICLPLGVACATRVIRAPLLLAVLAAPVAHLAGSVIDVPWCWPLFLVPSAAVLFASLWEVGDGSRRAALTPS